jgi:hypothetical protein
VRFVFKPVAAPQQVEHGKAAFIADNHLVVDQTRSNLEQTDRRRNGRE